MIRRHAILIAGVALTVLAGVLHTVSGDTAGTIAAAFPLLLVAPLVAQGTEALRGRLSNSVVGIVDIIAVKRSIAAQFFCVDIVVSRFERIAWHEISD